MKFLKRTMIILFSIALLLAIIIFFYLRQPQFGALPKEAGLELVKKSPNYKNGKFRNVLEKPTLNEGYTTFGELYKLIFKSYPNREPIDSLPSVKTNLKAIPTDSNVIVWFGHSSFFLQLDGVKILVDPVSVVKHHLCLMV